MAISEFLGACEVGCNDKGTKGKSLFLDSNFQGICFSRWKTSSSADMALCFLSIFMYTGMCHYLIGISEITESGKIQGKFRKMQLTRLMLTPREFQNI